MLIFNPQKFLWIKNSIKKKYYWNYLRLVERRFLLAFLVSLNSAYTKFNKLFAFKWSQYS